MNLVYHPSPRRGDERALLILLPGFDMTAADVSAQGFVAALHEGEDAVDLVIAEPPLDSYLDGTVTRCLLEAIAQERRRAYRRVWLGGISLGCFAALLAAAAMAEPVDGVLLLSPYLGSPGFIAEVERAGGIAAWQAGTIAENDGERRLLAWLHAHRVAEGQRPRLLLGYGRSDRFVAAAELLAARMPAAQVHAIEGGHDWPTWTALWRRLLETRPFSAR